MRVINDNDEFRLCVKNKLKRELYMKRNAFSRIKTTKIRSKIRENTRNLKKIKNKLIKNNKK